MVTDSAEKGQENKDDCEKAPNTKEIPKWNGVTNISCPRLNELFGCQKVAHSVLFYILIFLFVLVFVYILRKLVSLPSGHAKHNSRKPNNDSTGTAVYNHSRDTIPKRLPTKWPKIDTSTDHLPAHLTETTTSKDKNSRIYNVPGGSGQSYGWSGFYNNNPDPKIGSTSTGNLEGLRKNDKDYGKVYPDMAPEPQPNTREQNNKILEASKSVTNPDSAPASSTFGSEISQWSAWNYPESSGFRKANTDSSFLKNQETSGIENKPSELSGWENSRNSFKNTDSKWPTWGNLENTAQERDQPRPPTWSFAGYSGSDLVDGSTARSQQNSGSQLRSHVPTPMANGGNYGKWDYTSSPWVKWGSRWLPGSGFGWFRADDQDSKRFYGSQSSSPRNRFYSNEASRKLAYSDNVKSAYKDNNNNPAGQTGDNSNPVYSSYNEATSANIWKPYYNNGEINQTEDWGDFNILNGQNNAVSKMASNSGGQDYFESSRPSATTNNKNEQYQFSPKVVQEETDDRIHRWPLEEGRVEEPVKKLSSASLGNDLFKPSRTKRKKSKHRRPFKNKSQQGSKGQMQHKHGRPKRKHKKSNTFHSWKRKKKTKINSARQTQEGNHFKKSKIAHHGVLKSGLRRRTLKVKTRVKSKVKGAKVKGKTNQLSAKVSRLKTSFVSKRRGRMKTSATKHKSKKSRERFPSYATYKNFIKRHQTSNTLVGKWHRTIHHVKRCKTLSKFKRKGKVQLSRQYLQRKRKYKYTVLSCRYINNEDDATDDIGDEGDELRSENQICREFWFITNGKIILRKITKHHSGQNTYTVMLCKKGSVAGESKVNPTESHGNNDDSNNDDDTDVHKRTRNDSHNNDYQDLNADDTDDTDTSKGTENENSDRDDDDSDIDDDITDKNKETENKKKKNFDSDDKTVTNKKTGNEGVDDDDKDFDEDDFDEDDVDKHGSDKTEKKKKLNDDNDFDDDDFDDKATDNDNKNTDTTDSTTDTDDKLTNTQSGDHRSANNERNDDPTENDDDLDDIDIDDEDDVDGKNKNTRHDKNRNSHKRRKLLKNKSHKETSKSSVKKSFIPKHYRTHKVTKKRKHKMTSKTDTKYDNSDVYQRLLKGLTENNNINDRKPALAKLVAAISQKYLNSKFISKRVNNKKLHPHSRNKKNKRKKVQVKKNQSLSFNAPGIKNANNIKSFLQNLLTNSNNLQSHSQVEREQPTPDYGPTKEIEEMPETVSTKPSPQTDTKDLLKLLLPNIISKSTSLTTAVPSPSTPTTKATTHKSDDDSPILNLLNKLGMKSNLNGKVLKTALQRLLPSERMKNNLSTKKKIDTKSTSVVTTGLKHSQAQQKLLDFNQPQPSSLNSNEQLPGLTKSADNSPPSATPTTIPSQNYLSPPRSPNPPIFTTKSNNAEVAPTPQGPVDETANQSPFGYPAYRSSNPNPYSYQTSTTNVLCFGDSLTSGYYNHGRGKHPYSIRLNQLLNVGGKHPYKIVTRGVVGEMAHGSMAKRLPKILNEGTHFDWVIILGGTNDVAHVKNFGDDDQFTRQLISIWSPKIVNDIEKLHGIARRYGARTVILTIPETAYELWPEFQSIRNMRLSVNAALRKYASQVRDNTVLCDLAYKLPRSSLSKELQKFYWNDHIHLNPAGYNKMADVIGQCIQPYLTK